MFKDKQKQKKRVDLTKFCYKRIINYYFQSFGIKKYCSDKIENSKKSIKFSFRMGNEQDTEQLDKPNSQLSSWQIYQKPYPASFLVTGLFYNEISTSQIHYRRFFADEQKIFFQEGETVRYQNLFLTSMEQKFYYINGEKIYALKLTNPSFSTTLSTYDKHEFISFYCFLAKFCILSQFERHFDVKEQLGKGSYGTVFRGINKFSREEVALKVFDKKKLKQNKYWQKVVQNEIYVLQKLKKSYLSPLYEVFQTVDCLILVLEIAKEGDLLSFLLRDSTLIDEKLIKQVFEKILQNLAALHGAKLIHRDIKPENVVIRKNTNQNQVSLFICDFSISIIEGDEHCIEMRKFQAGSKGYLAPEVILGNVYDEKCDIFSFGCLAYLLLSGRMLFEGRSNQEISILTEDNDYIERTIQKLVAPKGLKNLLKRLLEVDSKKRISARQALDLEYFSDKEQETPYMVENDQTLKEFIEKRISIYENTTRGQTF